MYTRFQYRCLTEQFIQVNDMRIFDAEYYSSLMNRKIYLSKKKKKEEKQ